MRIRTIFRALTWILILAFPLVAFAEYKVVIKKNGKIIEGKLVAEDDTSITIINAGARLVYKKDTLDLERMKELNESYTDRDDVKGLNRPSPSTTEPKTNDSGSLADIAKQNKTAQPAAKASSDVNEQVLLDWVGELEQKNKVTSTQQNQIELSKAKKGLAHYRSRNTKELSTGDERLMLEQLVNALDSRYRKELESGAPEEQTNVWKKRVEDTRQKLTSLSDAFRN